MVVFITLGCCSRQFVCVCCSVGGQEYVRKRNPNGNHGKNGNPKKVGPKEVKLKKVESKKVELIEVEPKKVELKEVKKSVVVITK